VEGRGGSADDDGEGQPVVVGMPNRSQENWLAWLGSSSQRASSLSQKAAPRGSCVTRSFPVLSDAGVPLEEISRLVGHSGTTVTEFVYRHQLKPVIQTGATLTDQLFGRTADGA